VLQVEIVCCAYYHLRVQLYVAKSKSDVYFLQHENLLHGEVVIRATNNLNLQRNILAGKLHENVAVLLRLEYTTSLCAIKSCLPLIFLFNAKHPVEFSFLSFLYYSTSGLLPTILSASFSGAVEILCKVVYKVQTLHTASNLENELTHKIEAYFHP